MVVVVGGLIFLIAASFVSSADSRSGFRNSLGMEMQRISPGTFMMGNEGEIDYHHLLNDEPHTPYRHGSRV